MKFQKGSVRRSLRYSMWDGIFASMMAGISDTYLIPYAIALGATASQVAILSSLPVLVGAWIAVKSAGVTERIGSRTHLINLTVFFHALSWMAILLVPVLLNRQINTPDIVWPLLAVSVLFVSLGAFAVPAWQSLMSDYIPVKKRGQYFGWRNRLQGIMTVLVSVGAGLCLNYYGKTRLTGFAIIFVFAMVCRFLSWLCLLQMKEPFRKSSHDEYFSFFEFLRQIQSSHFTRFVFVVALMNFSVNLSAPLLSVFLLKALGFSYAQYMVIMTTATFSGFAFQGIWGKYADRYGNIRMIKIAGWGIALFPVLWLVSQRLSYLILVQFVAGIFWGGFNMLLTNFMMEAAPPQRRIRSISYFNVTNSVFLFLGAAAGGLAYSHLPPLLGYTYLALFTLSGVGRCLSMVLARRYLREVRVC